MTEDEHGDSVDEKWFGTAGEGESRLVSGGEVVDVVSSPGTPNSWVPLRVKLVEERVSPPTGFIRDELG